MRRQTQIVVGREQQDAPPVDLDLGVGRAGDRSQPASEPGGFELIELSAEQLVERRHVREMPGRSSVVNSDATLG